MSLLPTQGQNISCFFSNTAGLGSQEIIKDKIDTFINFKTQESYLRECTDEGLQEHIRLVDENFKKYLLDQQVDKEKKQKLLNALILSSVVVSQIPCLVQVLSRRPLAVFKSFLGFVDNSTCFLAYSNSISQILAGTMTLCIPLLLGGIIFGLYLYFYEQKEELTLEQRKILTEYKKAALEEKLNRLIKLAGNTINADQLKSRQLSTLKTQSFALSGSDIYPIVEEGYFVFCAAFNLPSTLITGGILTLVGFTAAGALGYAFLGLAIVVGCVYIGYKLYEAKEKARQKKDLFDLKQNENATREDIDTVLEQLRKNMLEERQLLLMKLSEECKSPSLIVSLPKNKEKTLQSNILEDNITLQHFTERELRQYYNFLKYEIKYFVKNSEEMDKLKKRLKSGNTDHFSIFLLEQINYLQYTEKLSKGEKLLSFFNFFDASTSFNSFTPVGKFALASILFGIPIIVPSIFLIAGLLIKNKQEKLSLEQRIKLVNLEIDVSKEILKRKIDESGFENSADLTYQKNVTHSESVTLSGNSKLNCAMSTIIATGQPLNILYSTLLALSLLSVIGPIGWLSIGVIVGGIGAIALASVMIGMIAAVATYRSEIKNTELERQLEEREKLLTSLKSDISLVSYYEIKSLEDKNKALRGKIESSAIINEPNAGSNLEIKNEDKERHIETATIVQDPNKFLSNEEKQELNSLVVVSDVNTQVNPEINDVHVVVVPMSQGTQNHDFVENDNEDKQENIEILQRENFEGIAKVLQDPNFSSNEEKQELNSLVVVSDVNSQVNPEVNIVHNENQDNKIVQFEAIPITNAQGTHDSTANDNEENIVSDENIVRQLENAQKKMLMANDHIMFASSESCKQSLKQLRAESFAPNV